MQEPDTTRAPSGDQERRRIAALRRLAIPDDGPDDVFDMAVWLACHVCGTSSGALSLVDEQRVRLRGCMGRPPADVPRGHSFCTSTILSDDPLHIPDASCDPRFATHPAYVALGMRFYAGAPLVGADGERYGALCVFDREPHRLDDVQLEALQKLARQVSAVLEARRDKLLAESHEHTLVRLIESIPDGVIACESGGKLRLLNRAAEHWFAHTVGDTPPERWSELIHVTAENDGRPLALEQYPLVRAMRGEHVRGQTVVVRSDAHPAFAVSCDAEPVHLGDGEPAGAIAILHDVGNARIARDRAAESDERFRVILQSISEAVIATDRDGRISFTNRQAGALLGLTTAEALGRPFADVVHVYREASGTEVPDPLRRVLATGQPSAPVVGKQLQRADGQRVAVDYRIAPIKDAAGAVLGAVAVIHDVSEARHLARRIEHQATHDALTGLPNRRYLETALSGLTVDGVASDANHALLFIDLDQLKVVNDTCGHEVGDRLLKQAAETMAAQLRPSDLLTRFGGDEFVVVLHDCTLECATATADRLRAALEDSRFSWNGDAYAMTASIGAVTLEAGVPPAEALSRASGACHLAKEKGQNRVHVHHLDDTELRSRQDALEWVSRIRTALDEDRFVLFAQRITPLAGDGLPPHYEVLVRLCDRDGVPVPPMAFIPVAERYGLMPEIDRWVLENALAHLATEAAQGHRPQLAINLSGRTLGMDGLTDFVRGAFERHGVPYEQVCFEITETAAIANLARAQAFIGWGRARGCRFALDDFGSGMSSFAYLKQLQVDHLKIDGSFIRSLTADRVDEAMVIAIQHVASVMGLRTIAEFVESDAVIERLRQLGVDFAQGYAVHRPEALRGCGLR